LLLADKAGNDDFTASDALTSAPRPHYVHTMPITLSKSSEVWLQQEVASGRYASVDEAVEAALLHRRLDAAEFDDDALDALTPAIEEAIGQLDSGEGRPASEIFAKLRARCKG
jgi:putative addiction module CopG family antidote